MAVYPHTATVTVATNAMIEIADDVASGDADEAAADEMTQPVNATVMDVITNNAPTRIESDQSRGWTKRAAGRDVDIGLDDSGVRGRRCGFQIKIGPRRAVRAGSAACAQRGRTNGDG